MKKFLFVLLATVSLISCEDTQTNEVALQAKVDDRLYTSTDARAALNEDGTLTIQGFNDEESMTIQLSRLGEGNFTIGEGSYNYALYEDMGGSIYTTNPNGEGVVTISELNETNKTLSGTFNFNAFLPGIDTIYVSQGTLYNVSYTGGDIVDPTNAGLFSAKARQMQPSLFPLLPMLSLVITPCQEEVLPPNTKALPAPKILWRGLSLFWNITFLKKQLKVPFPL